MVSPQWQIVYKRSNIKVGDKISACRACFHKYFRDLIFPVGKPGWWMSSSVDVYTMYSAYLMPSIYYAHECIILSLSVCLSIYKFGNAYILIITISPNCDINRIYTTALNNYKVHILINKSISWKKTKKSLENEILAKGNNSCKRRSHVTKVELDLYYVETNSYMKFQLNMLKDDKENPGKRNFSKGQ